MLSSVPRTEDAQLKVALGNSPALQWLELSAFIALGLFSISGQGLRSCTLWQKKKNPEKSKSISEDTDAGRGQVTSSLLSQ